MANGTKPHLHPGEVVGRYRIDGVVGKGGFGAVYRATQTDTGVPVALKILLKNFSSAKTDSKRFKREAALVQRLRHPRVVELLDYGYTDRQQPFIAFELLDGEPLSEVLKASGALPVWRAGAIARDVLEALEAAHAIGVIHRDIKPGNVFLLRDHGGAKVLDFGIAKTVNDDAAVDTQLTEAGQMIGTPHYMAPEQVRGTGVMPGTDLYALGLVTAEMISGARVVTGHALIDVYMTHIQDEPLEFPAVVRASPLWPVIERATQKPFDRRYPSATAMLQELRPILARLSSPSGSPRAAAAPVSAPIPSLNQTYRIDDPPDVEAPSLRVASADDPLGSGTVLMIDPGAQAESLRLATAMGAAPSHEAPSRSMVHTTPMPTTPLERVPESLGPASITQVRRSPAPPAALSGVDPASPPAPLSGVDPPTSPVLSGAEPVPPSDPLEATVDMSDAELQRYLRRLAPPHAPQTGAPGGAAASPANVPVLVPPPARRAPPQRSLGPVIAVLAMIMVGLVVAVVVVLRPF